MSLVAKKIGGMNPSEENAEDPKALGAEEPHGSDSETTGRALPPLAGLRTGATHSDARAAMRAMLRRVLMRIAGEFIEEAEKW